jgi:hypothetical protein
MKRCGQKVSDKNLQMALNPLNRFFLNYPHDWQRSKQMEEQHLIILYVDQMSLFLSALGGIHQFWE